MPKNSEPPELPPGHEMTAATMVKLKLYTVTLMPGGQDGWLVRLHLSAGKPVEFLASSEDLLQVVTLLQAQLNVPPAPPTAPKDPDARMYG